MNELQRIIHQQQSQWECAGCGLYCEQTDMKCRACEAPKPGTVSSTASNPQWFSTSSSGFSMGNNTFQFSTTSGFAAPASPTSPASPAKQSGGFSFGGGTSSGFSFGGSPPKGGGFSFGVDTDGKDKENVSDNSPLSPYQINTGPSMTSGPFTPVTQKKFVGMSITRNQSSAMDLDTPVGFRYTSKQQSMDVDGKEREEVSPVDVDESAEELTTSGDDETERSLANDNFGSEEERKIAFKNRKNDIRRGVLRRKLEEDMSRIPVGSHVVVATGDGSINGVLGRGCSMDSISSNFPLPIPHLYGNRFQKIATGAMSCAALTDESNELYVWGSNEHGELTENPLDIPDLGDESDLPEDKKWAQLRKEYLGRLTEIYQQNKPEKLDKVEDLLDRSRSDPHGLYERVCSKYGIQPKAAFVPRMSARELKMVQERALNPSRFLTDVTDEREFARRASSIYWTPARMRLPSNDVRVCQIDFGAAHVVILDENGLVYSMGTFNSDGLVGHHWDEEQNKIVLYQRSFYVVNPQIPEGTRNDRMRPIREIASGANHFLMLDDSGSIWQMGVTQLGQRTSPRNAKMYLQPHTVLPTMRNGRRVRYWRIRVGDYHNMAISRNFELFTWGQNNFLQCGHPLPKKREINDVVDNPRFVQFKEDIKVMDVHAGQHFTVVLDEHGRVWSFGRNACNQLGRKTERPPRKNIQGKLVKQECKKDLPDIVPDLDEIDMIAAGATFWFARSKNDHQKVKAFGFSNLGCCGVGNWHAASGRNIFDSTVLPDDFVVDAMCGSANHSLFLLQRRDMNVPRVNPAATTSLLLQQLDGTDSDGSTSPGSNPPGASARRKRSRRVMERDSKSPPDMEAPPKKSQKTETKTTASSRSHRRHKSRRERW